jgi:prepilin-type N-terminal cleavage/methylation domain-containing protein
MPRADTHDVRRDDGFTLIEMLAVMIIMAVLLSIAIGFQAGARVRAGDAAAKSNIDVAIPAISAYGLENGGFAGMTLGTLQASYAPGVANVTIVSADSTSYCVASTVEGRSWYKLGPAGSITTTPCP